MTKPNAADVMSLGLGKGYRLITNGNNNGAILSSDGSDVAPIKPSEPTTPANPNQPTIPNTPPVDPVESTKPDTYRPNLVTDVYTFSFEFTAPIFSKFTWGTLSFQNVSGDDLIRLLRDEASFGRAGYRMEWLENRVLAIKLYGRQQKTISNFTWEFASAVPYTPSSSHQLGNNKSQAYNQTTFMPTTNSLPTTITNQIDELITPLYKIDFTGVEKKFIMFTFAEAIYQNMTIEQLNKALQDDPNWTGGSFTMRLDGNTLIIERLVTSNGDHNLSEFSWQTVSAVSYDEYGDGGLKYASKVVYDKVIWEQGRADVPPDTETVHLQMELNTDNGENLKLLFFPLNDYENLGFNHELVHENLRFVLSLQGSYASEATLQQRQPRQVNPALPERFPITFLKLTVVGYNGVEYTRIREHAQGDFPIEYITDGNPKQIPLTNLMTGRGLVYRIWDTQ